MPEKRKAADFIKEINGLSKVFNGRGGGIRTHDPLLPKLQNYPDFIGDAARFF